ncbi:MAG: Smr/MutS family protein [Alphaproteobacteria bacterium]|nr:Smr/MutS family protein [Alphaproteobacteria bacterium]
MSNKDDDRNEDAEDHEDETSLWKAATRDVQPLPGKHYRQGRILKSKPATGPIDHAREQIKPTGRSLSVPRESSLSERSAGQSGRGGGGGGIDRRTLQRLERGQMEIEARLDLHGLNQAQAREALLSFITGNYSAGKRCILVITGKGRARGQGDEWWSPAPGVLRRKMPDWIAEKPEIAGMVVRTVPARPQHGGDGAFYILLRRKRPVR